MELVVMYSAWLLILVIIMELALRMEAAHVLQQQLEDSGVESDAMFVQLDLRDLIVMCKLVNLNVKALLLAVILLDNKHVSHHNSLVLNSVHPFQH
jgi:hypothetical protein